MIYLQSCLCFNLSMFLSYLFTSPHLTSPYLTLLYLTLPYLALLIFLLTQVDIPSFHRFTLCLLHHLNAEDRRESHVGLSTWSKFPSELFPLPLKLYLGGREVLDRATNAPPDCFIKLTRL